MIVRYLILKINFKFEILRAAITIIAAYLLNSLSDSITNFWLSFNTFTTDDLARSSLLFNKLLLILEQIFNLFIEATQGNPLAIQLLFEIGILANIYGYFLSRIIKNKNNIQVTRLKDVILSLIGYVLLFLLQSMLHYSFLKSSIGSFLNY